MKRLGATKKRWVGAVGGLSLGFLLGCGDTSSGTAPSGPKECEGGNKCACPDSGPSLTLCTEDGSEVCDCACNDFKPTVVSDEFDACGGSARGGWELASADPSQVPGHDVVLGCPSVHVAERTPPKWLMVLDDDAHVLRSTEDIELQLLVSCAAFGPTCDRLPGTWEKTACGTCEKTLKLGGIEDDHARWSESRDTLRIDLPNFKDDGSALRLTYSYCVSKNTLTLRDYSKGATYTFESRYFSGSSDACLARSLDACEDLDGCHQGSCQGFTACALAETQTECEDQTLCTWASDKCGGFPSKRCSIEEYGVDPGCSVAASAP